MIARVGVFADAAFVCERDCVKIVGRFGNWCFIKDRSKCNAYSTLLERAEARRLQEGKCASKKLPSPRPGPEGFTSSGPHPRAR